jgi:hypothetical protein
MVRSMVNGLLLTSVALALLGCSGSSAGGGGVQIGPEAVPAQGSLTLVLGQSPLADPGFTCPINATYAVGSPAPTEASLGVPLLDGENGASISCSVSGAGQSFAMMASLSTVVSSSSGKQVTVKLALDAPAVTATNPAPAQSSVFTSDLSDSITSSSSDANAGCTLHVLNDQLKPGAVWGTFSCPKLTAQPSSECAASGTFVFEDCVGA